MRAAVNQSEEAPQVRVTDPIEAGLLLPPNEAVFGGLGRTAPRDGDMALTGDGAVLLRVRAR